MKKETNVKIFFTRRLLAVLMVMLLVVSIIVPNMVMPASADETNTTTNGYYDANGVWHQGGNGYFTYEDGDLVLGKTAKPVEGMDNIFEITLSVSVKLDSDMFSPNSIATVLVIDVSGSMKACDECGSQTSHYSDCSKASGYFSQVSSNETRLYAAKQAAIAFLDEMRKDAPEGVGRYVHLVSFATDAENELSEWQDVTTDEGYSAVKSAINALSANGGTNLDDGLGHAMDLIKEEEVSSISKGGKNVVVLTDGNPTYYIDTNGSRKGNGSDTTKALIEDTVLAADDLREIANVFTICYNASNAGTYSGGPTVGKFLEDDIASPATEDITYAYNADSSIDLIDSFMSIVDIELEKAEVVITDPMPENIYIPEGGMPDGVSYIDGNWSLHDVEPTERVEGEYTIYTYTIIYKVELDPYEDGVEPGKFYPANKPTQIVMEDGTTYDFPVPGIMPIAQEHDVTYNSGAHGSIEGEDENGNVTYEDVTNGKETPKPPAVTPDDGWYFVGWTPEISDKVDGDVTYVAIYSQKQVITVTGNSNSVTYNGAEQTVSGFTVTGLPQGWTVSGIDYSASGKNVGSCTGSFSGTPVIRDENQQIVPADQYTVTFTPGTLTIDKRDLTITADSNSKIYDGAALTDNGWKDTAPVGLAATDNIVSVVVVGSQTVVGQSANIASGAVVMNGNEDVTNNYNITYVDGTLTVEKSLKEITITANSATKEYDGAPLTDGGYTVSGAELAQGDVLTVVVEGSQTNAGVGVNKVVSYKVMRGNADVTSYYTFATPVDGTLTVEKRDLTITADSANKVYDGATLTDMGWKDTAPSGLADGDEVTSVTVTGSQTVVGSSSNVASGAVVMRGGNDVTANYNITYVDGTLTVSKVGTPITITANSSSKIYDGLPLTDGGYSYTQGVLAQGDILIVIVSGSQTDVGTGTNEVASYRVFRDGIDVTSYYTFASAVSGTLTVTKRDLTITADSASKEYDGTELTDSGYEYSGLATTDTIVSVDVIGSQLNVGSSSNKAMNAQIIRDNSDVTDNYNITYIDGTLAVTKNTQTITITADSASKEYDGTPLTADGYTFTAGILADGDELIVEVEGSQTFVGSSANTVVSYKVMRNGVDITSYYTFATPVSGTLEVTAKSDKITITANSDSKEYDGTPLTNDGYTVEGALADGDELVVVIEGSQTNAGSSANTVVSIKVMRGSVDVTDNYSNLNTENSTLTVTKVDGEIIVTAGSASKEYDGTPLTSNDYTANQEILASGDELVVEIEGSQTFVGQSANTVVSIKVMRDGVDVTENYNIGASVDGVLEITPNENTITITAVSASKEYDGTALVNGGYTFTQGILANDDVLVVDVNGSQTFVGTSENEITSYKVMRGELDVTDSYTIVSVNGTLEVTKRYLVIIADSTCKVYDGTPLIDSGYEDVPPVGLASGDTLANVTVTGSQTDVGSSANVASGAVIMRGDKDVTSNYDIDYIDGTLTVGVVGTPIIITAASDSKVFDGFPLTNSSYTFTQGVLAPGDELIAVVSGKQTDAGVGVNKVVSYKVMRDGVDVTSYYTFATPVMGTLTVEKRDITITAGSASKEYDGTELTDNSFTVDNFYAGEEVSDIIVTLTGSQTFVGTSANVASDAIIWNGGRYITENFNITYVDGTLTVTKKTDEITVTAGSASKEYDGTPLTSDEYTVNGELAEGDEFVVVIEGSQTVAGSSSNVIVSIKVIRDGVDVTENYENLIPAEGTLTVEKIEAPIIVTAGSSSKDYDGTPLTDDTFTFTQGVLIEGDELVVVIEGSQTEVGSSENKVVSVKVMRGELDVTDSYNIENPVDGELVINSVPKTGDNTNITLWNVMMLISLLTLLALTFTSRKKQTAR